MEKEIYTPHLEWIDTQAQHMVFLTESFSKINSGSYHVEGVERFKKALEDNFLWLDAKMESIPMADYEEIDTKGRLIKRPMADALLITKRPDAPIQLLFMGHMDTVFAKDHPFQDTRYVSETIMNGPGVADLKGGLVVMLKALEALEKSPYAEKIGYQIFLNPDEEIGSVSSDPMMKKLAQGKMLGMIYEPSLPDGSMAGARKGSGNFSIRIQGKAAHAGRNPEEGRNAVVLAGEMVQNLFALNGKREGVTLNPARIDGDAPFNAVPDMAVIRYNVRLKASEDMAWMDDQVEKIIKSFRNRDGFEISLHGKFTRAPKPLIDGNLKMAHFVQDSGRKLGLEIAMNATGGCCDGNNLWRYGLANIDTLGVRGAHIHSADEIVYLDSLPERAKLSALMLMRIARGEFAL
jgi:glutamate carboxypeptidase